MYKLCKTDQSARRQREMELGLLEAMKVQRYEDISISDLCARLQIPRKSFYRYFDSKEGALYGLIDHTLLEFDGMDLDRMYSGKQSLQQELEQFFLFWLENRELLRVIRSSGLCSVLFERAVSFSLTDTLMPRRFLLEDSEAIQKHVMMFGVCGLLSMVISWHDGGFKESAAELASVAARILGKPLLPGTE